VNFKVVFKTVQLCISWGIEKNFNNIKLQPGDNRFLFLFAMLLCGGIEVLMHLMSETPALTESGRYRPEL
jgi:hypothetical protein